jgi:hypothetical protein
MASFITRTLDHSGLRPEGLSIQRNSNRETQVSLRDSDFQPVEDALIDVFSAQYDDDAFDVDDGECELRFIRDETPSHSTCEIDIGDQPTDDEGNVEFTLVSDVDPVTASCSVGDGNLDFLTDTGSESREFWAWTGDRGDQVDADTELSSLEDVARPVGKSAPDYGLVSGGLPTGDELAKMGETVSFTLQLKDQVGGTRNHGKDADAGPDRSRNPYILTIEKYIVARVAGTDSDADGDSGSASTDLFSEAPGDWNYGTPVQMLPAANARIQVPFDTVVWPNGDGEYVINLTHPDLNAANDDNDVGVRFTLTPFLAANDLISANLLTDVVVNRGTNSAAVTPRPGFDVVTGSVIFSDDASDPHAAAGESSAYRILAGRTGNSVTVTVLDQYGDGMRNVHVSTYSDLDVIAPTIAAPDQVVYPEEVDYTVQSNEDADGDDTSGEDAAGPRPSAYATFVAQDLTADPPIPANRIDIDPRAITRMPVEIGPDDVEGSFRTRRNGSYRIGYTYTGTEAQTETITPESLQIRSAVFADSDDDGEPDSVTETVTSDQELGSGVSVYWTKSGNSGASAGGRAGSLDFLPVLVPDVPNLTIVANEPGAEADDNDNPMAYFYDEDDTFIVAGVGATFEMFEEALSATYKADGIYVDYVSWQNYVISRPGRVNRTIWELTLSCTDPATLSVNTDGNEWTTS